MVADEGDDDIQGLRLLSFRDIRRGWHYVRTSHKRTARRKWESRNGYYCPYKSWGQYLPPNSTFSSGYDWIIWTPDGDSMFYNKEPIGLFYIANVGKNVAEASSITFVLVTSNMKWVWIQEIAIQLQHSGTVSLPTTFLQRFYGCFSLTAVPFIAHRLIFPRKGVCSRVARRQEDHKRRQQTVPQRKAGQL